MAKELKDVTKAEDNYSQWYNDLVVKAGLAENSAVRGCMVIKPYGYAIWEKIQRIMDAEFKKTGHENVAMPVLIPESLLKKEGELVNGFAPEVAWVTAGGSDPLEERLAVRPTSETMFCDHFSHVLHSYRDLPLRVGELGLVHRHELSGALHGLFRVRCFTQDDAHIFMTWDQMEQEIQNVVRLFDEVYSTFGLSYQIEVSTMPEDHIGEKETWDMATDTLKRAIEHMGKTYVINEGDGAFYGPKLDFHLSDSLGRTWQCGTIQLDMQMPERFDLEYVGADGGKHRPVMIHRVVLGSIERFIGVITEHFAGAFPTWLAPVQVKVLAMTDRTHEAAKQIADSLDKLGIRVETDLRNEKIGFKIREAQMQRIPYMLIIGDKEVENNVVAVRSRKGGDLGAMTLDAFKEKILEEVKTRARD